MESDILILPGTPLFDAYWEALPPPPDKETIKHQTAGEYNYIVRSGGDKYQLMECVHSREATEYVYGGEYDVRLSEIASDDDYDPNDYITYAQWKALVNGEELTDGMDS